MPRAFDSTTGNSNYSLFMGPREAHYINHINSELLEIVAKQNFIYWPIERDNSEPDDIYGESERKVPRNPIKIYGWIYLDQPETKTTNFGHEVSRRIECYLHIDRLTEIGVFPKNGDFIEWDNQFFEIISTVVPQFAHGLSEVKVGVNIAAVSTREDKFNPRINNEYEDAIDHDSDNPY